jgi:hypothetical protein
LSVSFVLSVVKERVLSPTRLGKLRQRLATLAGHELGGQQQVSLIASKRTALLQLQKLRAIAQRKLGIAESDDQRPRNALIVDQGDAQQQQL